jgi:hypothetical protein
MTKGFYWLVAMFKLDLRRRHNKLFWLQTQASLFAIGALDQKILLPDFDLMENMSITSPLAGIALLVLFVVSGKVFRDNWKQQGPNWKRNCWVSGLLALGCFAILAFVPFAPSA